MCAAYACAVAPSVPAGAGEGVLEGDGLGDGDALGEGVGVGVVDGEGLAVGDGLGLGDGASVGAGVAAVLAEPEPEPLETAESPDVPPPNVPTKAVGAGVGVSLGSGVGGTDAAGPAVAGAAGGKLSSAGGAAGGRADGADGGGSVCGGWLQLNKPRAASDAANAKGFERMVSSCGSTARRRHGPLFAS